MKNRSRLLFSFILAFLASALSASPLHSPTWGFTVDLPEGYEYSGGDNKDRFSFESPDGARFDLIVYAEKNGAPYADVEELARDIARRLNNEGGVDFFDYRKKKTCLMELSFPIRGAREEIFSVAGWALCTELNPPRAAAAGTTSSGRPPLLLAMAYGPAEKSGLRTEYLSALDSLAPETADKLSPGAITEYTYPRKNPVKKALFGLDTDARFYEEDAEAAQSVVDREFGILRRYIDSPAWKDAWIRFYRAIYRDSFERLADAAFQIERKFNVPPRENRELADAALKWTQSFKYERDLLGSDFVNLVNAATEGRGDCDSRAMLWALVMARANIPAAMMVSRHYSHAMGLAELDGSGARFSLDGKRFLVAETTTDVSVGLIGETVSETRHWLGIPLE